MGQISRVARTITSRLYRRPSSANTRTAWSTCCGRDATSPHIPPYRRTPTRTRTSRWTRKKRTVLARLPSHWPSFWGSWILYRSSYRPEVTYASCRKWRTLSRCTWRMRTRCGCSGCCCWRVPAWHRVICWPYLLWSTDTRIVRSGSGRSGNSPWACCNSVVSSSGGAYGTASRTEPFCATLTASVSPKPSENTSGWKSYNIISEYPSKPDTTYQNWNGIGPMLAILCRFLHWRVVTCTLVNMP